MTHSHSSKLDHVLYDLRGPVHDRAAELSRQGHDIMALNIGNPAPFDFAPAEVVMAAVRESLAHSHGYSDSQGLELARQAIADYYGLAHAQPEQVIIGNGVSELVSMSLQALLETGDEVLIPSPDYPLWTAATVLNGGTPIHYPCRPEQGWAPDIEALHGLVSPQTRALVVINPNNPTGAVYSRDTLEALVAFAAQHGLVLLSDEIYDRIVYEGAQHIHTAAIAQDRVTCLTFSGLSKTHRLAGYRVGWVLATGPGEPNTQPGSLFFGLRLLASMRMCASVPAQHAVTAALHHDSSIAALTAPGGRLFEQRRAALDGLGKIPGLDVVAPYGALYIFIRFDPAFFLVDDDERFVLDFLENEHVLLVHGRAFNLDDTHYVRMTFLPNVEQIRDFCDRLARHLEKYRITRC